MDHADLVRRRLWNQHVTSPPLDTPALTVRTLGAVQAQDYPAAKWALAQRTKASTDASLDEAFARGTILRTHVMRPTWHFVTPEDIRWLLALTAPRVNALMAGYYRKMELDERTLKRSCAVIEKALRGGRHLTRQTLSTALTQAGVFASLPSMRLGFVLMWAELGALICSGPRHGKQFTYALVDERVPPVRAMSKEEALAELLVRYFSSHGPATIKDFAWWSGLTVKDTRAALDLVDSTLERETISGQTYFGPRARRGRTPAPAAGAHLLPAYDEGMLSYRDNRVALSRYGPRLMRDNGQVVVIDGRVVGSWRRTVVKESVRIEVDPFVKLTRGAMRAIADAAARYGVFLNMPATVVPRR
jgi:Winged helix DNA-binding domain